MANAFRGLGHTFQTEVCRPCQDRGKDRCWVFVVSPGSQVGEGFQEPSTVGHVPQKLCDPDARHERVNGTIEVFTGLGCDGPCCIDQLGLGTRPTRDGFQAVRSKLGRPSPVIRFSTRAPILASVF